MRNALVAISVNTIASLLAGLVLHWITLPSLDDAIGPVATALDSYLITLEQGDARS